ncbi:MAG: hypothetical protein CVU64_11590 [Deltaproteobacteria bacterium HGW-Deltaproteobacteria-21]|nr:MAG: hypothetical protein CVU64_11590 [Deltaproteobacteria bacterium HGW-Deltaproteobacteria-21]
MPQGEAARIKALNRKDAKNAKESYFVFSSCRKTSRQDEKTKYSLFSSRPVAPLRFNPFVLHLASCSVDRSHLLC